MRKLHIITGQTATGKTEQALHLARQTKTDIISADSRQVYAGLDIITGKDIGTSAFVQIGVFGDWAVGYYLVQGIKIWGCDIVTPDRHFSTHDYLMYLAYILDNTIEQTTSPIVVGGSYLYIHSLLSGLDETVGPNWKQRKKLEHTDVKTLQNMLQVLDPKAYVALNNSDLYNPHRLMRRIEIAQHPHNSNPIPTAAPTYEATHIDGYHFASSERLQAAITARVEKRIALGAFDEVEKLLSAGYSQASPGLKTLGYQQIIQHFNGEITKEEAIALWIRAEVQYAKRQWTFMKRNQQIDWHSV